MIDKIDLDFKTLTKVISDIGKVNICVLGDVCIDIYWFADMKLSKLSRETPHFPLPIVKEEYSLGGAGNVMANIAALGVERLIPISIIGKDWRAGLVNESLTKLGIETKYIFTSGERLTPAYCKPIRTGISELKYEDPRLDFENYKPPDVDGERHILEGLDEVSEYVDIIAVSDQYVEGGVVTPKIREKLSQLGKQGKKIVVDSRERILDYKDAIIVPNEVEAIIGPNKKIGDKELMEAKDYIEIAEALYKRNGYPVIITLGEKGALWADHKGGHFIPTKEAKPPIDIVGAGDTFLAAFSCAYATGLDGPKSLAFANLASGVTVKKINTTGTASPEEITNKYMEIYR